MEEVIKIIKELQANSGKRLQEILEENKNNQLLKDVLYFVYNPFIVTGLSNKKINKDVSNIKVRGTRKFTGAVDEGACLKDKDKDITNIFDYLIDNNTGRDEDIAWVQGYIKCQPEEYREIYEQIFTKELKLGITSKTINKVWKDFIPEFNVMLAEKYWDRMENLEKEKPDIIITQKLDGCFIKDTKILMEDGSEKKIKDIEKGDFVLSYNERTDKIEPKMVVNKFDNGRKSENEWLRIQTSRYRKAPNKSIICTKNHKFFNGEQWIEAENLKIGDVLYTEEFFPTRAQEDVLLGIGLGDGVFTRDSKIKNLRARYSKTYKDVDILNKVENLLSGLSNVSRRNKISGYGSQIIEINTKGIITLPDYFYKNWLRYSLTFTHEICDKITPLTLAIFYIDDGSRCSSKNEGKNVSNIRPRVCFSMYRHKKENIKNFVEILEKKFNIKSKIRQERPAKNECNSGLVVDLGADETEKFYDLIAPYIPKSLRKKKLGWKDKWQNAKEIRWWEDNKSNQGLYQLTIKNIQVDFPKKHKNGYEAYDLEIEDNHNYFANKVLVHNCRAIAIHDKNGIQLFSRQGKPIEGLNDIKKELSRLPNGCYDGELLLDKENIPSKDLYRETVQVVNSKSEDKKDIIFNIFDYLPIKEFYKGKSENPCSIRKTLIEENYRVLNPKFWKPVPILYKGEYNKDIVQEKLNEQIALEHEGIMINIAGAVYEAKRTKNILKVKAMQDCDLKIIGFEEGTGKNKGTLGAVIVDYKGFEVKVGSGFTDEDREYFWNNQKELLGRVITVQYFEETTNIKDNSLSLRFPVYLGLREEGKEVSYF